MNEDLGPKKRLYEKTFHTNDYFCYDPETEEFLAWSLNSDAAYQPLVANEQGRFWSRALEAWIGLWPGKYLKIPANWLRLQAELARLKGENR